MQLQAPMSCVCRAGRPAAVHIHSSVAIRAGRCRAACVPVEGTEDAVRQLNALQLQTAAAPEDHPDNVPDHGLAPATPARTKKAPRVVSPPIVPTFAVGDIVMGEVTFSGTWGAKVKLLQQPDVVAHVPNSEGPVVQEGPGELYRPHPDHAAALHPGLVRAFKVTHIPVPLCRNSKRQVVLSAAAVDTSLAWQRLAQAAQLCFDTHQPLPVTVRHQAAGYVRCSALGVPAIVPRSQLLAPGAQDATTAATDSTTSTTSSTSSSQQQQEVLEVMVMELDQEGKRAVMSQRLAAEAAQQRAAAAAQRTSGLVVGQLATGTITSTGPSYVRVALDGTRTSATLPVANISCYHIYDARNVFQVGDKVAALVADVAASTRQQQQQRTPGTATAASTTTSSSSGGNVWSWKPSNADTAAPQEAAADSAAAPATPPATAAAAGSGPVNTLCYAAAPAVHWQLSAVRAAARQTQQQQQQYHHQQQQRQGAGAEMHHQQQQVVLSTAHLEAAAGDMLFQKEAVFAAALQQYGLVPPPGFFPAATEVDQEEEGVLLEEEGLVLPDAAVAQQLVAAAAAQQMRQHAAVTAFAEANPSSVSSSSTVGHGGNGAVAPGKGEEVVEEQEWLAPDHQQWQADEQQQWEAEQALIKKQQQQQGVEVPPVLPYQEEQGWCAPGAAPWQEPEQQEWATAGAAAWQPAF